jgi:hypothetical protein
MTRVQAKGYFKGQQAARATSRDQRGAHTPSSQQRGAHAPSSCQRGAHAPSGGQKGPRVPSKDSQVSASGFTHAQGPQVTSSGFTGEPAHWYTTTPTLYTNITKQPLHQRFPMTVCTQEAPKSRSYGPRILTCVSMLWGTSSSQTRHQLSEQQS